MNILVGTCCLTTAIAIASVFSTGHALLQRRALPWIGGLLVGIAVFWILPELAVQRGWLHSLSDVLAIALVLAGIDRYIYPICPFCAAYGHTDAAISPTHSSRHATTFGWPMLAVGCIHSFFDGWTIALSQLTRPSGAAAALSWGVIVHKFPESVAIGILAARFTANRTFALGAVVLIQTAMAAGGTLGLFADHLNPRWAAIYSIPACAFLLLLGLLALQDEWRSRGGIAAIRAAIPGLVGCGLAALASQVLPR